MMLPWLPLADLGPEADFLREMAVELLTRSK